MLVEALDEGPERSVGGGTDYVEGEVSQGRGQDGRRGLWLSRRQRCRPRLLGGPRRVRDSGGRLRLRGFPRCVKDMFEL